MNLDNARFPLAVWVLLMIAFGRAAAEGDAKVIEPRDPTDPLNGFSITEHKFARLAMRSRELAIRECCEFLETRVKANGNGGAELDIQAAYAATLLGKLRPSESQCIDALCKNVTLHPEFVLRRGSPRPLTPYPVAQALADIGGREVADGIHRRMKERLDRKELLILAHVLNLIDHQTVTLERMRLAKEQSQREDSPEVREVFFDNLAQVRQWLEDPKFPSDNEFRP